MKGEFTALEDIDVAVMSLQEIEKFCFSALRQCGASELQAHAVAMEIMDAEAEGIRNVGLGYMHLYLNHLRCGKVHGDAVPSIVKTSSAAVIVDAAYGFCHTAYLQAESLLVRKAREQGLGLMSIKRSSSAGVLGWFVRRLAHEGLISLMFANSSKAVAAHGGKVPFFGTNPLAFGSPRQEREPIIVDMATASTARVNLVKAAADGQSIEPGHAIDAQGNPTTDPSEGLKGAQLPLGGAKGFGLGLIVDLFAGVLTGSNCSFEAPMFSNSEGGPPNVGQTIVAISPDFFTEDYLLHLEQMLSAMTTGNEVRIPGQRRHDLRRKHSEIGVDVPDDLLARLEAITTGAG